MSLDTEWEAAQLLMGLQVDAAKVTALTLTGQGAEADQHLTDTRYRERLAQWQALTGRRVTAI